MTKTFIRPPKPDSHSSLWQSRNALSVMLCARSTDLVRAIDLRSSLIIGVQYIPRNMHTVLLGFALLWLRNRS